MGLGSDPMPTPKINTEMKSSHFLGPGVTFLFLSRMIYVIRNANHKPNLIWIFIQFLLALSAVKAIFFLTNDLM